MSADAATAMVEIGMPRLSDSMEEATVLQWLKQPGEVVRKGEPIVEVETDKATIVYEAELDGVLEEIVVGEGETAALGAVIARVRVEGAGPAAAQAPQAPAQPAPAQPASPAATPAPAARPSTHAGRHRATPVARRLAAELGVSLEGVAGTGPGGRIVRSDVRVAAGNGRSSAARQPGGRGAVEEIALTSTQRTIAQRMSQSRTEIPEFTLEAEVDMEAVAELREELRELGREPLPSFNDLVVKAVAASLRKHPAVNSSWANSRIMSTM